MESVLFGRNIILELSLKVDEKKISFFFEEAKGRREKKLVFLRRSKVESSKVRFGPKRTDSILLCKLECLLLICTYTNAKFIVICKPRTLNDGSEDSSWQQPFYFLSVNLL